MSEILIATKVTKTNKVVELLKMWNDKSIESTSSIEELFLEKIGCNCILYYHNTYYDMETKRKDCRKEVYAIFAEIKENTFSNHREGCGLWFCRIKNNEKFEYKMISKDCSFNNFFKLNCSSKGVRDMWDKTEDVSTEEDRLRFLDK